MTDAAVRQVIEPQTGVAFVMSKGSTLTVIDVQGEQVSDLPLLDSTSVSGCRPAAASTTTTRSP